MTEIQTEDATMRFGRAARHVAAGKKAPAPAATPPRAPAARQASPIEVAKILKDATLAVTQAGARPTPESAVAVAIRAVAVNNTSLARDPEFRRELWKIADHQINVTEAETYGWIDAAVQGEANGAAVGNALAAELYRSAAPSPVPPVPDKPLDANGMSKARGQEELRRHIDAGKPEPLPAAEPPPNEDPRDHRLEETQPPEPLPALAAASFAGCAVPERQWLARHRIPLGNVTALYGDGGGGKTLIALQLAVATERGTDWLGSVIDRRGPVMFFTAEEDADELHRRLDAIAAHLGLDLADLAGLHLYPRPGADCVLGTPDRNGKVNPTALFASLQASARLIRPLLIVVESAADVFAGNENDRPQVRQFIGLLRRLALDSGAAVLLIAHPSLGGIASGKGTSGSTAWNNSVRSRLYLTSIKNDDNDEPTGDLRQLEVMKANYGPANEVIRIRWQRGVFVPEAGATSPHQAAAEAECDATFLRLLDLTLGQGRHVSDSPGKSYAPAIFEGMEGSGEFKKTAFRRAMERLFAMGAIIVEEFGPASKRRSRLVRASPRREAEQ